MSAIIKVAGRNYNPKAEEEIEEKLKANKELQQELEKLGFQVDGTSEAKEVEYSHALWAVSLTAKEAYDPVSVIERLSKIKTTDSTGKPKNWVYGNDFIEYTFRERDAAVKNLVHIGLAEKYKTAK